jgi:threonine/homoserine/homoserine lactone efflux protein
VIGCVIAVPVGPAAALCIRRSISIGAVAGYLTGLGAALGDAVFGAVAAFGLSFVEQFVAQNEAWLRGIGGLVLAILGWTTMQHRPRTVGDPVADDREHRVATHFHFATSSFFITVFNPLTIMAFGAAFAGRNLAGVGSSLPDATVLVAAVFSGALGWWAILCTAALALRQHFTGIGLLWLNRISGAIILAFGLIALVSLLPLPWGRMAEWWISDQDPGFRNANVPLARTMATARSRSGR